jgi:hypothetical protein
MEPLLQFDEAVVRFGQFLDEQDCPAKIQWAFRDDWYSTGPSSHHVAWPLPANNEGGARHLYDAGRDRGLVELRAVFFVSETCVAIVVAPERDEIQGWNRGLRLSIPQPFTDARPVRSRTVWFWHRITPGYRRFQRHSAFAPLRADHARETLSNMALRPTRAARPNGPREPARSGPRG